MLLQLKQTFLNDLQEFYPENEILSFFFQSVQKVSGYSKSQLLANPDFAFSEQQKEQLSTILTRLKKMEPIQYILEECEFFGLPFYVNPSVLIPRPETEELVEWIISDNSEKKGKLLDIGTGSGCIAISTGKNLNSFSVSALDISEPALVVAKRNAEKNGCEIYFILDDILKNDFSAHADMYDVLVSNPPYIREVEKQTILPNVLDHEPHRALFVPDHNPLIFYEAIALFGTKKLNNGGTIYFEINEALGQETVSLLSSFGYQNIILRKDIFGKDRMIRASKQI